uniref:Uncharacterized protein n=1 Tax=Chaetoceros debilis TaxID=122233 RepID=A0A7S3VCX3_9STRA
MVVGHDGQSDISDRSFPPEHQRKKSHFSIATNKKANGENGSEASGAKHHGAQHTIKEMKVTRKWKPRSRLGQFLGRNGETSLNHDILDVTIKNKNEEKHRCSLSSVISELSDDGIKQQETIEYEDFPEESEEIIENRGTEQNRRNSQGSQLSIWSKTFEANKKDEMKKKWLQYLRESIFQNKVRKRRHMNKVDKLFKWIKSIQRLDPRYQILRYFDEVARKGGALENPLAAQAATFDLMRGFMKASAFTVWRPTSREAICKMMKGEVTGKGLDVKGKSAKKGILSSMVPYLQIHNNDHKKKVLRPPKCARVRVYFKSIEARSFSEKELTANLKEMTEAYTHAREILSGKKSHVEGEREKAMENYVNEVDDPHIYHLDDSGIGLDIPERVFFETYITRQDLRRSPDFTTGRPSIPEFQDMNCATTRKYSGSGPRAVVLQTSTDSSAGLCPQGLIIAYEDGGSVVPVASDFDCFTVGTRGVAYDSPMAKEQVELMKWLVQKIKKILKHPASDQSWTSQWLKVMTESYNEGFSPVVPQYGFGDPKSYEIMEGAANRFRYYDKNGAVRHGAECFNYVFPQELDEWFLVISDTLPGNVPWVYVGVEELKNMLLEKIDDDFCFPINPKWILADSGWKKLWDKMLASTCENTVISMETWYPKESGIRELIEDVHSECPNGYAAAERDKSSGTYKQSGRSAMILAQERLRRHVIMRRVKLKIRVALMFGKLGGAVLRAKDAEEKKKVLERQFQGQFRKSKVNDMLSKTADTSYGYPMMPVAYFLVWLVSMLFLAQIMFSDDRNI